MGERELYWRLDYIFVSWCSDKRLLQSSPQTFRFLHFAVGNVLLRPQTFSLKEKNISSPMRRKRSDHNRKLVLVVVAFCVCVWCVWCGLAAAFHKYNEMRIFQFNTECSVDLLNKRVSNCTRQKRCFSS